MIKQPQKLKAFIYKIGSELETTFGVNHVSTILHGGIVLKEFTLNFSDIDLIVVLKEVSQTDINILVNLWNTWAKEHPFGEKLWINLFSQNLLHAPESYAWTVSKKGVRPVQGMPIDGMELHTLLHHGKTIKGERIIQRFPRLPKNYQIKELGTFLNVLETYSMTSPLQTHLHQETPIDDDIGIILSFPRYLYNLQTGRILTKCNAAKWYAQKYKPFQKEFLLIAQYRLEPETIDSRKILELYRYVPDMIPYFWNSYFRHFGLQVNIPKPVSLGSVIQYQSCFQAIRSGLVALAQRYP